MKTSGALSRLICGQSGTNLESASGLRKLLETTNEHLRALDDLGQPTNQWDAILVFWISEKMDFKSWKQ